MATVNFLGNLTRVVIILSGGLQFEDLMTDLIYLRKDEGFTAARLPNATAFVKLLGGEGKKFTTVKARLLSAIGSLSDERGAEALMAAMALAPEYEGLRRLQDRRAKYGERIKRSTDTVADRENAVIHQLAVQLLAARYALAPLPENAAATMHNAAIHERVQVVTLVTDRRWAETRERYRLISLMDGVDFLEISSDIPAKIAVTCDCVLDSQTTARGRKHRFFFKTPLRYGELASLSFTMTPDDTVDEAPVLIEETRAFHNPTLSARFEVVFMGEKPDVIWRYTQLPIYERPGVPTGRQLLDAAGAVVCADFTELHGGLFSGVAWEWGQT